MRAALHAEWTKLRTIAATGWLLLGAVASTVAVSGAVAAAVTYASVGSGQDVTRLSLTGVYLGQAVVAILAVLTIAAEYSSDMILVTLTAMPRRLCVLAGKAGILSALVGAAGTIAVLGSILAGRLLLPAGGFTVAHGYALLSLSHASTLRAAFGTVIYLTLIGLLSLGVATAVREPAVATGLVLGLLYLFPILAALAPDPHLRRHLEQIGPMTAGLAIQATTNLRGLPIGPWAGLGVLALWAVFALVTGGLSLARRDA